MHDCHSLLKESFSTLSSVAPSNADRIGMNNCAWKAANNHKNTPAVLMNVFFFPWLLWWLWVKISSKSIFGGMAHVWTFCIITQRVRRRTVNYPILTLALSDAWRCCNASACEACAVADAWWISWAQGVKSSCGCEGSPDAHSPLINVLSSIMKHRHQPAQVNLSSDSLNRLLQEFIKRERE